jgi:hypothetical protein
MVMLSMVTFIVFISASIERLSYLFFIMLSAFMLFFGFAQSSQRSKDAKIYVLFRATLVVERSRFFLFRAKLAREQRRKGLCFVSSEACGGAKSNFFCFAQSSQGSKDAKVYVLFRAFDGAKKQNL